MRLAIAGLLGLAAAACPGRSGNDETTPRPASTCQKDKPCPTAELPACGDVAPKPLADVLAGGETWNGQAIDVVGPLWRGLGMCTLMACSAAHPCCNRCSASLVLSARAPDSPLGGDVLTLQGENLDCVGDDSAVCCPHDAQGEPVVASGTLAIESDGSGRHRYRLEGATVCTP